MRAVRYTLSWLALIAFAIWGSSSIGFLEGVKLHYTVFGAIGVAMLIGITELIEIFDDIRKSTIPDKTTKGDSE